MYSETVMDHFTNPRNAGTIENADGIGEVGNPVCGDMMTFYIKVKDDMLADVKFKTFGCVAAIAVSSKSMTRSAEDLETILSAFQQGPVYLQRNRRHPTVTILTTIQIIRITQFASCHGRHTARQAKNPFEHPPGPPH